MRLDKFLKVSRLIKRRTVAKEVCDKNRISINQRPAKSSSEVRVGDELEIRFGQKTVFVRIESLAENARKEEAAQMYTVIREEWNQKQPAPDAKNEDYLF